MARAPDGGDPRRAVPRTDALLADPRVAEAAAAVGRRRVRGVVHEVQERVRAGALAPEAASDAVVAALPAQAGSLRPVLNATGVLVHTNLGRAPLSAAAVEAVVAAAGATDVEFDLAAGARARRGRGALAALAAAVPDAGDVHVVTNGAAAALLAVTALAGPGGEVLVSRGELVEIGDGFRLPDLLVSTGARLREVGTTNRTVLADYADAVGPDTRLVLKVHPSNFVVSGFTAAVGVRELATLPVPVLVDIGSGLLAPDASLPAEPDAATALRGGAALVTASGDKLLGGPQAGLVLGRADLVQRVRRHPLARAVRCDKLVLAALEATLAGPEPPVTLMRRATAAAVAGRAEELVRALRASGVAELADVGVRSTSATVGGGGAPGVELPSSAVSLPESWAGPLRTGDPAVVGRVADGRLLLDLRSVQPSDDAALLAAVLAVARRT